MNPHSCVINLVATRLVGKVTRVRGSDQAQIDEATAGAMEVGGLRPADEVTSPRMAGVTMNMDFSDHDVPMMDRDAELRRTFLLITLIMEMVLSTLPKQASSN